MFTLPSYDVVRENSVIEIVFLACLVSDPQKCEEKGILLPHDSPYHCLLESSLHLSRWSNDHPGWVVAKFSCQPPGTRASDA